MTGPPRDRWLIAGTDRRHPYPCFCRTDPPSPRCCANTEETA